MPRVAVSGRDELKLGPPIPLLETDFSFENARHFSYDVAPDGDRGLLIEETGGKDDEIQVVLNWFEELERLVRPTLTSSSASSSHRVSPRLFPVSRLTNT